jgi:hypothetical protein
MLLEAFNGLKGNEKQRKGMIYSSIVIAALQMII